MTRDFKRNGGALLAFNPFNTLWLITGCNMDVRACRRAIEQFLLFSDVLASYHLWLSMDLVWVGFFFSLQEVLIAAKIVMLMVAIFTLPSALPFLCYCSFSRADFFCSRGGGTDSVTASCQHQTESTSYSKSSAVVVYAVIIVLLFLTEPHFHLNWTPTF